MKNLLWATVNLTRSRFGFATSWMNRLFQTDVDGLFGNTAIVEESPAFRVASTAMFLAVLEKNFAATCCWPLKIPDETDPDGRILCARIMLTKRVNIEVVIWVVPSGDRRFKTARFVEVRR